MEGREREKYIYIHTRGVVTEVLRLVSRKISVRFNKGMNGAPASRNKERIRKNEARRNEGR